VVAIIGVIALIGIPAFQEGLQKSAVKNLSRSIMFHMKEARVTAMAESRRVNVSFDAYGYTYDTPTVTAGIIQPCKNCKNINVTYDSFSSNIIVKGKNTPLPPTFTFKSRGTGTKASVIVLSGTYKATITVNGIGRAYVQ